MSAITFDTIWAALTADERQEACMAIWVSDDEMSRRAQARLTHLLCGLLNFREKYLKRQPPEKLAEWLLPRLTHRQLHPFLDDVLRAWLISAHAATIECFLDAQGIPRDGCFLAEDVPAPDAQSLARGIRAILHDYGQRTAALYLGYISVDEAVGFAEALPAALEMEGFDVGAVLKADDTPRLEVPKEPSPAESTPAEVGEADTTLDNLLIRTIVASALGTDGAFSQDEVEHLVDEVVELSPDRQRSHFHRGFVHALFGRPPQFEFTGMNHERQAWYTCGYFLGLVRQRRANDCITELLKNQAISTLLANDTSTPCGPRLLPHLYAAMRDNEQYGMLRSWFLKHFPRMAPEAREVFLNRIQRDASSLLRRGKAPEAGLLLDLVDTALRRGELADDFATWLQPLNMRKRAQAHQAQGDFGAAATLLDQLASLGDVPDAANAMADRGLIRGGFRSLHAICPPREVDAVATHREALRKGLPDFLDAVEKYPDSATNGRFCLGMLALLGGESPGGTPADHFQHALNGMLGRSDAYAEGGLLDMARFGLAVSLLETLEPSNLRHSVERLQQVIEGGVSIPPWLWARALQSCALYDDRSPARRLAGHLLQSLGPAAFPILQQAGAQGFGLVRRPFFEWARTQRMSGEQRWNALQGLFLPGEPDDDGALDADILDEMELLAAEDKEVRARFIGFLETSRHFEPTWSIAQAETCLVRLHELDGRFDKAMDLLGRRFYRLRSNGSEYAVFEAKQTAERIRSYGLQEDPSASMITSLDEFEDADADATDATSLLRSGKRIVILYVGGNETQANYCDAISKRLKDLYPGLDILFYLPGWSSSWIMHFEKVKPMIQTADAVVLSIMVRTQFGEHVRRACGGDHPWFSCTGTGRKSLESSIEKAAQWAIQRKNR